VKATTPSPAAAACEHDVARDRGTQHPASAKSARRDISLTSCDQREVRTIGVIATTRSIRAGWLTAHCRGLHAAYRSADHGREAADAQRVESAPLRLDHVADGDRGERYARLARAVRGRGRETVSKRVDDDDAEPAAVEPGPARSGNGAHGACCRWR